MLAAARSALVTLALLGACEVAGTSAASPSPSQSPAASKAPAPAAGTRTAKPAPSPAPAALDVYLLVGGDRISGRTLSKGKRTFVVQTPYGRLSLPRAKVERVQWSDGREERILPPAGAATPSVPRPSLELVVTGGSFWYAWDPQETGVHPSLRFELRLDDRPLCVYQDDTLDPQDLPGATVNSFSFEPAQLKVTPAAGVDVAPAAVRRGRVSLRLTLPADSTGRRRLRVAYQVDAGTAEAPAWQDVAQAGTERDLSATAVATVALAQDPGRMEFSGRRPRRMKYVETFALGLTPAAEAP
jgi:hypothetical protein